MLKKEYVLDIGNVLGFCLVSYLAGNFPVRAAIHQLCGSLKVPYKFHLHHSEWIVFKLDSEGDRSKVFTGVPNFANRRQLMLKYMCNTLILGMMKQALFRSR